MATEKQEQGPSARQVPKGKVLYLYQGACGFSGQQYPQHLGRQRVPNNDGKRKSQADRQLEYYSRQWPSVEMNTSTYSIPSPEYVKKWCMLTPRPSGTNDHQKFLFHFKAYGLFCSREIQYGQLPSRVRDILDIPCKQPNAMLQLRELPSRAVDACWDAFHDALYEVYKCDKMAVVMFQFPLQFSPSEETITYVEECRKRLDLRYQMAVEFRNRRWWTDPSWRRRCSDLLRHLGVSWISADELKHETYRDGSVDKKAILPIALSVTSKEFHYIRIHRRSGMEERRLREEEISAWGKRLALIASQLEDGGHVYMLWGTEHRNVPQMNRDALEREIHDNVSIDGCSIHVVSASDVAGCQAGSMTGIKRYFRSVSDTNQSKENQ